MFSQPQLTKLHLLTNNTHQRYRHLQHTTSSLPLFVKPIAIGSPSPPAIYSGDHLLLRLTSSFPSATNFDKSKTLSLSLVRDANRHWNATISGNILLHVRRTSPSPSFEISLFLDMERQYLPFDGKIEANFQNLATSIPRRQPPVCDQHPSTISRQLRLLANH